MSAWELLGPADNKPSQKTLAEHLQADASVTHQCCFLGLVGWKLLGFLLLLLLLLLVSVGALHLGDDLGVGLGVLDPLEAAARSESTASRGLWGRTDLPWACCRRGSPAAASERWWRPSAL